MCRLMWLRVVPVSLFAILAFGIGIDSRADDVPLDHSDAHAAEHGHGAGDELDHADEANADHAGHGEGDEAGGHHPDTMRPPIFPDWAMGELFVFSLTFFLLYVLIAKKVAWVPLIAGLDSREARVNRALADAEAARMAAAKLLDDHQKHLDAVTEQVKEIISKARGEAEQEKARIIAEADAETTAMRDQAIADIHAAREQALMGLDEQIDSQVSTATQHVLG